MKNLNPVERPFRLQRSVLSVPATRPALFTKALNSDADCIMLDCEDSVAPADKSAARDHVISALSEIDWKGRGKTLMVRVNAIDTHYMYRDVVDIVEQGGNAIDSVMLPKAGCAADVYMLDALLGQIESAKGIVHQIAIDALIESAPGAQNVNRIASASPRLEALHFGAGDFAASCGARTVKIGGLNPDYPGDPWLPVMQSIVIACRANGLRPIDSAYGDFADTEGYLAAAKRAAALGFSGKWAIHPSQVELANRVMSPPQQEVEAAHRVLEKMAEAEQDGQGATRIGGEMIDVASIRMAQQIVELDEAIRARQNHR